VHHAFANKGRESREGMTAIRLFMRNLSRQTRRPRPI